MTATITTIDKSRRRFLVKTSTVIGAVGSGIIAVPFIASMSPSARARSAGAPVEVDISRLAYNQQITIEWRGKPVWVLRRNKDMLKRLEQQTLLQQLRDPDSQKNQQPIYAKNNYRAINSEYLVVIGICTHLGCVPTFRPELAPKDLGALWPGGYFCPCHGSKFDLAGRVFKGVPAPTNLVIPPYHFMSDTVIKIGEDKMKTA
ncbi:Ubiquinol-cytochrome C reductase iron-sulfur subunit [hydrothermal vent metagenome]|uniref:Ubiquinol-cytochrome c reductase iron-sulfur subunit n=1 Tax=hydrothermal vent metagenome TaxID=652676 RepID=A0A3B1AB75_9ZZZZ